MDEYEEIVLLEEFNDALVGCVFDPEGTPIPCYQTEAVWRILAKEGYTEEEADSYVDQITEGLRIVWIHPLEIKPEFTPDKKPHLRLVH